MLTLLLETCSSPLGVIILALLSSGIGAWGANRAFMRRLRLLEDDFHDLLERFERFQKKSAGRISGESRASHLQEAAEIAAKAQKPQTVPIRLPGRIT